MVIIADFRSDTRQGIKIQGSLRKMTEVAEDSIQ